MNAPSNSVDVDFSEIDRHFADFVVRFGGNPVLLRHAAAALSRSIRDGHVCVPLTGIAANFTGADLAGDIWWPDVAGWRAELQKSHAVGPPERRAPLVLDSADRLYLRRYWDYQASLAQEVRARCSRNPRRTQTAGTTQEDAIAAALRNQLTIIAGGPGTGKTSTVVRILAQLLERQPGERLRIALTAPTGKAASRLEEAVREGAARLGTGDAAHLLMQLSAKTIHRLLGPQGRSASFRYNEKHPLPVDILVVDEASMVALPLLAKLFSALTPDCRILLLGDRDQLASVEPGAVLADMVDAAGSTGGSLAGSVITLQKNYRFAEGSNIQKACAAVRRGDADATLTLLRKANSDDLISTEISALAQMQAHVASQAVAALAGAVTQRTPADALKALNQFRVLTPLRHGRWGASGLTDMIERALLEAGLISARGEAAYAGKPILISQNDYELDLYNGDLGVLLPDPAAPSEPSQLYGWFLGKEHAVRRFAHARLPEHETAYAMTVHKSQGSEFERVLFVLPDRDSPVLTRELVYTALTRARAGVNFCWTEPVLRAAVGRGRERASGLRELLIA